MAWSKLIAQKNTQIRRKEGNHNLEKVDYFNQMSLHIYFYGCRGI